MSSDSETRTITVTTIEEGPLRPHPRLIRAFGGEFGCLLTALMGLLLTAPLIVEGHGLNLLLDLVASLVLVTGIHAAYPERRSWALGLVLAILELGMGRIVAYSGIRWLLAPQLGLWLFSTILVAAVILQRVLEETHVTLKTLQAAICVYFLLGLIWVFIYAIIDVILPGEFQFKRPPDFAWTRDDSRRTEFLRLFFFSYSTLSAVGSGLVGQTGWFVRMCACVEAMTGQIYLAVLVARLVGIHVNQWRHERS